MEQHLGEGERGAEIDAVAIEPRRVRVEHAVAPRHEVQIVAEPAQQRLERVAVRVDGAGEEGAAGQAHEIGGEGGVPPGRRERADVDDAAVIDGDREAGLEPAVHEDEVGAEPHPATRGQEAPGAALPESHARTRARMSAGVNGLVR